MKWSLVEQAFKPESYSTRIIESLLKRRKSLKIISVSASPIKTELEEYSFLIKSTKRNRACYGGSGIFLKLAGVDRINYKKFQDILLFTARSFLVRLFNKYYHLILLNNFSAP